VSGEATPFPVMFPAAAGFGPVVVPTPDELATWEEEAARGDPHLRSGNEVEGYAIAATDGEVGTVRDLIIDRESWHVRYLSVDTGSWFNAHEVVLAIAWIDRISWTEREVVVGVTRQAIKDSPPLADLKDLKRSYEEELYRAYGYPAYWI
jgi:hypothetical protein